MFYNEKLEEINHILKKCISSDQKTVIWGAGEHTARLLISTCLSKYAFDIVDKTNFGGLCCGTTVKSIDEITWDDIDNVIISSIKYYDEIYESLRNELHYAGRVIRLYSDEEKTPFYLLQKETDFLYITNEYENWNAACNAAGDGYSDKEIFTFNKDIALKHRDAVKQEIYSCGNWYCYDILAYLYKCVAESGKNGINILDYGGGFATVYYDLQYWLKNDADIISKWVIVDQPDVVAYGKKELSQNSLFFAETAEDASEILNGKADFILLGSCLQYIQDYKTVLEQCISLKPNYIMIKKTPVAQKMRISLQYVNQSGNYDWYQAIYPIRIFVESELCESILKEYNLVDSHSDCIKGVATYNYTGDDVIDWMTYVFERKK